MHPTWSPARAGGALLPSLLALLLLPVAAAKGPAASADFDFERAARECRLGHSNPENTEPRFEDIVEQDFLSLPLGVFVLHHPRKDLATKDGVLRLQRIATAVLALQDHWLLWRSGEKPKKGKLFDADATTLTKWVKSWRTKDLESVGAAGSSPAELATVLGAKADVEQALERFAERVLAAGEALSAQPMVLVPTRAEFVGLGCLIGLDHEGDRARFWTGTTTQRTQFEWNGTVILALEYFDPNRQLDDVSAGMSMDAREPTGLEQHVCSHVATQLIANSFGETLDGALESGMVTNLVIDTLGEDNTRLSGSHTHSTEGRTKFVAGGRSEGGKFPRLDADPFWRGDKGRDYFARVLHVGSVRGESKAAEERGGRPKGCFFPLTSALDPARSMLAEAPFLGDSPATTQIESEYVDDSREFFRAYSSGFVHWLQERKAKGDASASASFGRLLEALSKGTPSAEALESVYGLPLATAQPSEPSLEWSFVETLAKE